MKIGSMRLCFNRIDVARKQGTGQRGRYFWTSSDGLNVSEDLSSNTHLLSGNSDKNSSFFMIHIERADMWTTV